MKKTALLFAGQGAQYVRMGQDIAAASPGAKALYERADAALDFPLSTISFEGPAEKLTETEVCQPALYVHGLALLEALREAAPALSFEAAAGLSLGEFTAHAAAGTFDFETGLELVRHRGRLMQEACDATQGGMVSLIGATPEQARQIADETGLDAANFNCPGQVVLSGDMAKIADAVAVAKATGIKRALPLTVAGAYHSSLMKLAQEGFAPHLEKAEINDPPKRVMANVTGQPVTTAAEVRDALSRQVCGSVLWEDCVRALIAEGVELFVELGPKGILAGMCKRIDASVPCVTIGTAEDLKEKAHELAG